MISQGNVKHAMESKKGRRGRTAGERGKRHVYISLLGMRDDDEEKKRQVALARLEAELRLGCPSCEL